MPRRNIPKKHTPYTLDIACQTKRAFRTQHLAEKAAEQQMLENMRLEIRVYRCPDCALWHLTRATA